MDFFPFICVTAAVLMMHFEEDTAPGQDAEKKVDIGGIKYQAKSPSLLISFYFSKITKYKFEMQLWLISSICYWLKTETFIKYTILCILKTIGGTIESLKDLRALLTNFKNYWNSHYSLQNYFPGET